MMMIMVMMTITMMMMTTTTMMMMMMMMIVVVAVVVVVVVVVMMMMTGQVRPSSFEPAESVSWWPEKWMSGWSTSQGLTFLLSSRRLHFYEDHLHLLLGFCRKKRRNWISFLIKYFPLSYNSQCQIRPNQSLGDLRSECQAEVLPKDLLCFSATVEMKATIAEKQIKSLGDRSAAPPLNMQSSWVASKRDTPLRLTKVEDSPNRCGILQYTPSDENYDDRPFSNGAGTQLSRKMSRYYTIRRFVMANITHTKKL